MPSDEKPRKVVFCTPTVTRPFPEYLAALEASLPALEAAGWEHQAVFEAGCPYISSARATLLRKALDAKADVIVFLDHDLSWRPTDLLKLIETPGEVVAGLYRYRKDEFEFMGHLADAGGRKPYFRQDGVLAAERVPAGFLKITKEAVDRFIGHHPELCFGARYSPSIDLFNHGAFDGVWWGEDYAFSRRWRALGGDIWVVPDLSLTHHDPDKSYPGNVHEWLTAQEAAETADPSQADAPSASAAA
ncbi:hypothetical protein [Phenylobacterium sp.]|uniref:hypothetical protein n=1 Tax=Phenylobacterium sp. TaxID=1871053 RepID=UPI002FC9C0C2